MPVHDQKRDRSGVPSTEEAKVSDEDLSSFPSSLAEVGDELVNSGGLLESGT